MQIGFEAKRAFQNTTGLGNYARNLIDSLSRYSPEHHYHLFAPRDSELFPLNSFPNVSLHQPKTFLHRQFSSYWRSKGVVGDIAGSGLDIYHGLSAELPYGIDRLALARVVSVHDLIYERFPQQYKPADVLISRRKTRYACETADLIAAMSEQTKKDLTDFYGIPSSKIVVTYQSCHDDFLIKRNESERKAIRSKYKLPETYLLSVGSIIERKGLLSICMALNILKQKIPLVVIGYGKGSYLQKVKTFLTRHHMDNQVLFLNEGPQANDAAFRSGKDLPAIFQSAKALVYPSLFEGFGIPVLEAISSGIPVITSNISSMPEAGGDAALYTEPGDAKDLARAIQKVLDDDILCAHMISRGRQHARHFTKKNLAAQMTAIYQSLI